MAYHSDEVEGSVHIPYNWSYADAAARTGASGFVSADVGKLAYQEDTDTLWILLTVAPTWQGVGGSDPTAIHDNVDDEIHQIAVKGTPVDADEIVIEDSAATWAKKRAALSTLPAGTPSAHATSHEDGGSDEISVTDLSGLLADDQNAVAEDGIDTSAIHDDVQSEISGVTPKGTPVGGDMLLIEDSEASNAKKMLLISNLPGGADPNAIHDNVDDEIHQIANKATPVSADEIVIEDSVASWAKKRVAISNLPAGSPSFGSPTGAIDIGDAETEGISTDSTRADHQHAFTAPGVGYPLDVAASELDGSATTPARSDHVHAHGSGYLEDAHHTKDHATRHTDGNDDVQEATAAQKGLMSLTYAGKLDGIDAGADVTGSNPPQSHNNTYHSTNYLADVVDDTTPSLGGDLDLNGKGVILSSQTIDGAVSTGDLVMFDGVDWNQTDANETSLCDSLLGIYLGSNNVLLMGIWTTTGLTAGDIYYVSTTAGDITNAAPSGTGDIVRIIGYALSTTQLMLLVDGTFVEVA